jgi:hypothetical protein
VGTSADEVELDAIQLALRSMLSDPLFVEVDRLSISEQGRGPGGRWAVRAELPLGR